MLLIFALCAAVCLSLFFSSRETARKSGELSRAAAWASSCAEVYVSSGGDLAKTAGILGAELSSGGFTAAGDGLILAAEETGENTLSIAVYGGKTDDPVFSIAAKAVAYG